MHWTLRLRLMSCLPVMAVLCGCVSTPKSAAPSPPPVHVMITAAGLVNYRGMTLMAGQFADQLVKDSVDRRQEIRVQMADIGNQPLMKQIVNVLQARGYTRVMFVNQPRASSEVLGQPKSRTEMPAEKGITPSPDLK